MNNLKITANVYHEPAIIEGDRSALSRLHIALGDILDHNSMATQGAIYVQHFFDADGEEFDILIRLNSP